MKLKLKMGTRATLTLALMATLTMVTGVVARAEDKKNAPPPVAPSQIDPNTGLPLPSSGSWKDPNWKDPDKVLGTVFYDGVPLGEVARELRKQFNDAFDVLIPNTWRDPGNPNADDSVDPRSRTIRM